MLSLARCESLSCAALAALLSSPAFADTLIDHANGIQADAQSHLQHFTGLLIGDDGKVLRVLTSRRSATEGFQDHRRAREDAPSRPDRRARPCPGARPERTPARSRRYKLARRSEAATARLCRCASRRALDHRPRLEPGALARQALPDGRRSRRHRQRPPGGAPARRRPCRRRQQRRNEGRRGNFGNAGAARRPDRERLVRGQRQGAYRASCPCSDARRARSGPRKGAGDPSRLRRHRRRIHEHVARRLGGDEALRRLRPAQSSFHGLCRRARSPEGRSRGQRTGCMASGCGWAGSNSTTMARLALAEPG